MKTTSMMALIAVISAVSIGAVSMNGFSAIPFVAASVSPESGVITGHVEYILRDADGNIKSYLQDDNQVVNRGDDCVMAYTFNPSDTAGTDSCVSNANGFRFIGIGNATTTIANTDTTLTNVATTIAGGSPGAEGLMAMRTDNTIVFSASSDGGTVQIATETPFTFGSVNATTVHTAGLFDVKCNMGSQMCTSYGTNTNMFSVQRLAGGTGVTVASGDSLAVTWTITVGNGS